MRGRTIARERKAHEIDEPARVRPALEPAAPSLGRLERKSAIGFDLGAIVRREVAVGDGDSGIVLALGMRYKQRADIIRRLLPACLPQFVSLAHGSFQT
jgi:hypothetical protein